MAAAEVVQEPGHEVAAAVRASGRLEAWPRGSRRRSRALHPQHVRKWLYRATSKCVLWARGGATHRHARRRLSRRPRNGVLVMAHEPLTRSGGPRYVEEHRGVLVVALQSVAFGASPRRVPAGEAV